MACLQTSLTASTAGAILCLGMLTLALADPLLPLLIFSFLLQTPSLTALAPGALRFVDLFPGIASVATLPLALLYGRMGGAPRTRALAYALIVSGASLFIPGPAAECASTASLLAAVLFARLAPLPLLLAAAPIAGAAAILVWPAIHGLPDGPLLSLVFILSSLLIVTIGWPEQSPVVVGFSSSLALRFAADFFGWIGGPDDLLAIASAVVTPAGITVACLHLYHRHEVVRAHLQETGRHRQLRLTEIEEVNRRLEEQVAVAQLLEELREKAEDVVRESELRFRTMADSAPFPIWTATPEQSRDYFSKAWLEFRGRALNEECADGWLQGVHPEDRAVWRQAATAAWSEKVSYETEYRLQTKAGDYRWMLERGAPRFMPDGRFAGYVGACVDVTEQKRELQDSEEWRKIAQRAAGIAAWDWNIVTGKTKHSEEFFPLFGRSVAEGWNTIEGWIENIHPDDRAEARRGVAQALESGDVYHADYRALWPDNSVHWLSSWGRVHRDESGQPVRMFGVIVDITEEKEEQQVRAKLREKEVLLKEVHHRVKNNLQIVSSLLKFQSRAIKDPGIIELYRESQNRIQSMALIHEKLYQSKDLSWIDFGEYTRSLSTTLFRSYADHSAGVRLKVEADPLALDVDRSVPCGLILTELISNCLKHAFPNGRGGEIHVGVHEEDGRAVLSVRDDGVGIPPEFDLAHASSLGLQLAVSLADQLGGELRINRNGGTEISVRFDAFRPSTTAVDSPIQHGERQPSVRN